MEELAMAQLDQTEKEFGSDPLRTYLVGYVRRPPRDRLLKRFNYLP
jgi:hypothetical protein